MNEDYLQPMVTEAHGGITVVREDLCCRVLGSGKLRGLIPWFREMRAAGVVGVVNHAVSYSNSHAIVAFAARAANLQAVSYVNARYPTPQTELAATLGCRLIFAGPMQLGPVRSHAKRHDEPGFRQLPWGLAHPKALDHISALVPLLRGEYDYHVVPVGAGGYAAAVAAGLRRNNIPGQVVGVPSSGDLKTNYARLTDIHPFHRVTLVERGTMRITPFPSDPNYEWLAWPEALRLHKAGRRVCFWSVGVPLVDEGGK